MATTKDATNKRLATIRGTLPQARANARSVAALTDNPGCVRRRVFDAASIKTHIVAERLGFPVTRGQSPFAITSGNQFERRLKEGSNYSRLVEALKPFVALPERPVVVDLGSARGLPPGEPALRARAKRTDDVLAAIARGDAAAPQIVDHPVLVFTIGGVSVFLEPDALAFRVGSQLELVEIKSYPIIDGQADASKLSSTGSQAAVYLLALRAALERLGFAPEILRTSVILVAPRNFGRTATAHRIPLKKKMMALDRVLRAVPNTSDVVSELSLPATFTLDVDPGGKKAAAKVRAELERAVCDLPNLYVPECLSACDLAKFCRHRAVVEDDPSRLGRVARDTLAGVDKLQDALRLATKGPRPGEAHLKDVADELRAAAEALARARAAVAAAPKAPTTGAASTRKRAAG